MGVAIDQTYPSPGPKMSWSGSQGSEQLRPSKLLQAPMSALDTVLVHDRVRPVLTRCPSPEEWPGAPRVSWVQTSLHSAGTCLLQLPRNLPIHICPADQRQNTAFLFTFLPSPHSPQTPDTIPGPSALSNPQFHPAHCYHSARAQLAMCTGHRGWQRHSGQCLIMIHGATLLDGLKPLN